MDKTAKISLRLTEKEQAHLNLQCQTYGIKRSEYIRRLIEQDMGRLNLSEMESQNTYLQRKELIYEIHHIGVNINQIAHHVNSEYYVDSEKEELFLMMNKLLTLVEKRL